MRGLGRTGAAGLLLLLLSAAPSGAQTGDEKLKGLLDELNTLIDKGGAQNLADPWFLQDLRALADRYGETWPVVLLDHSFDSRSTLPKAPWEIRRGQMKMDWTRGLRSQVEVAGQARARSDEEVARDIIGGILGQALGGKTARTADPSEPALALAALRISNAFQLQAEITARDMPGDAQGGLELGVYQTGNAGYRLVLVPKAGGGATVTLLAVSSRGTTRVIDSADYSGSFTDDQPMTVTLSRRSDGTMSAAVGDTELFSASDQSFRDDFGGALIANRGGDYAVKWMTIRGTV